jgi:PST family polysaccharide transporter
MTQDSPIPSSETDLQWSAEELRDGLKGRSASSGAVMIVSQALQLLVWVGGTAVLARILTPTDFGYLAMVATLLGLVATFREFLLVPVVQRQDLSHEQASGLFWLNCLAGIASAAGVAILAPVLAWFFREPIVQAMTLAMAAQVSQ